MWAHGRVIFSVLREYGSTEAGEAEWCASRDLDSSDDGRVSTSYESPLRICTLNPINPTKPIAPTNSINPINPTHPNPINPESLCTGDTESHNHPMFLAAVT